MEGLPDNLFEEFYEVWGLLPLSELKSMVADYKSGGNIAVELVMNQMERQNPGFRANMIYDFERVIARKEQEQGIAPVNDTDGAKD